VKLPGR